MAARPVALVGALGRMGEEVRSALADEPRLALAGALEAASHPGLGRDLGGGVIATADAGEALRGCELAIVFAPPDASLAALRVAAERGVRCVVGSTGFEPAGRAEIERLAKRVAIVLAPNFSVAVNVLGHLAERAVRLLGPGFDAEIVELHHAAKRDAPSGTALWLADAVARGRGDAAPELVLSREGDTGPRPRDAIGVQALRGGDNPGEHTVLLVGAGERLELSHRATTRAHFARGALRAALWVAGRPPGLYAMRDVLGLQS
jgi:4-hydroxy-tetrahydrodipicolinate reductase